MGSGFRRTTRSWTDAEDREFALYLEMLWETGGSQREVAGLHRDNIRRLSAASFYRRQKLASKDKGVAALKMCLVDFHEGG